MLALHSQGVGSKWATGDVNQTKELAELLGYSLDQVSGVDYAVYQRAKTADMVVQT